MKTFFLLVLLCASAQGQILQQIIMGTTVAGAGWTLVQSKSASCSATTSCAVSLPGNTTSGNLVIFALMWGNTTGTITRCDGASCSTTCTTSVDSFNTVPSNPVSDTTSTELDLTYATMSTGLTSFTFCVSGGGNHTLRVAAYEYSHSAGIPALASVLDTSNTAFAPTSSAVTTATGGNITPAATGELIFDAIVFESTVSAITVSGTGYSEQPTSNGSAGNGWLGTDRADGCHNLNSVNTSTTCTFSWTTASGYSATIAAFKHN